MGSSCCLIRTVLFRARRTCPPASCLLGFGGARCGSWATAKHGEGDLHVPLEHVAGHVSSQPSSRCGSRGSQRGLVQHCRQASVPTPAPLPAVPCALTLKHANVYGIRYPTLFPRHYYYSAECFLREFAPSLRRTYAASLRGLRCWRAALWHNAWHPTRMALAVLAAHADNLCSVFFMQASFALQDRGGSRGQPQAHHCHLACPSAAHVSGIGAGHTRVRPEGGLCRSAVHNGE